MFTDLVKARKRKNDDDEVSQERIRELMDEMFKGAEDDDSDLIASDRELDDDELNDLDKRYDYTKGGMYRDERTKLRKELDEDELDALDKRIGYGAERNELRKELEDDEDGEMFKGDDERRELMDQVFSLVDDLSDEELKSIIESRAMRKAMAMQVFDSMPTPELADFVSQQSANGEGATEDLAKGDDMDDDLEGDDMDDDLEGDDMDDDDLEG